MEISNLSIENLELKGSLLIEAKSMLGERENEQLRYSTKGGRCLLRNVLVQNQGYEQEGHKNFWRGDIKRKEALEIILHGFAEFVAEDVSFTGPYKIEVPEGWRVTAYMEGNKLAFKKEKVAVPSWFWRYRYSSDKLRPVELKS